VRVHQVWRIAPALLLLVLLGLAVPLQSAMAQDSGSIISIDAPVDAQSADLGTDITFRGWAGNQLGPGTGVDRVIILDAPQAAGGVTLAEAVYGGSRPDVGQAYGAAMTNSGYTATWRAAGATGNKTFWVYAHSVANDGWTNKTVTLRLTTPVAAAPVVAPPPVSNQYNDQSSSRYRNANGLYNSGCDSGSGYGGYNGYGGLNGYNGYGGLNGYNGYNTGLNGYNGYNTGLNGYNGYNTGYNGYNTGYNSSQYCNSGYGGYGSSLYNGYSPYTTQYGNLYGLGYGTANCVLTGGLGYYTNTATGLQYPTYAQCISATSVLGVGNCVLQGTGYYTNTATGLQYLTYTQCISATTTGGNCLLVQGLYYNTTTTNYYSTYDQCINQGATGTGSSVVATVGADGNVTLTWSTVSYATGGYRVYEISPANILLQSVAQSGSVSITSILTGLTPGTSITFQVRAVSSTGVETAIPATATTTSATVAAPTNLTVGAHASTVQLTWTPSTTGSITFYQIQQSPTGAAGSYVNSAVSACPTPSATCGVVGSLTATTVAQPLWYFQVIAYVGATPSAPSNVVSTSVP